MTNYDVIESYADDFTKWRIENTGVTSTQKKIVIAAGTELKYNVAYKGFKNSIAEFDIKYTGNAVIRYQYNKEDGTTGIITINRSGIYHLPASIKAQKNFGFYCNPQTVTEEATIEQLPTSILKDFSGNGNHAYLYGGKGKLNSGMGVYKEVCSLNNDQQAILAKDDVYNNVSAELQMLIQQELINSVRDKVANSPRGKELLEKQLNNIRAKKDSIIEEANKELELFKKFQIAAQANPKLTYVDFCNNIKNKEV